MFNHFFDVLHQDVLIHLSLILMGLKAQFHHDHLSGIEPKLCVLAKHHRGKLVFELSAKLLQHDVALGEFPVLTLLRIDEEVSPCITTFMIIVSMFFNV